ncbi:MAG: hypothetical protein EAZ46_12955 [Runella sp.]|nr:MAG: hypothetical protein EAZ46_12955 [Runella sp.]
MIVAIGQLHNYCINERLQHNPRIQKYEEEDILFTQQQQDLRETAASFQYVTMVQHNENPWSYNRERMAKEIKIFKLTRPK